MKSPQDNKPNEVAPLIEGYEIIGKLGQGGTSSVWKARQVSLGRVVVIKVLYEHLAHDPEDIRHFKHEALIAANLKHTGIVQVYDFGRVQEGFGYYFVMEYVSGYTVGDWLRRKGKLEETDVLIIAHSVGEALRYAWDQAKIVHCDIKPENIMVDGDGTIKLTDLGLAQVVSTIGGPTHAANEVYIMGTPNYMSPEQARGEKNLDCRTDIYALGATLHHLLSGHLPFGGGDPNEIMERQLREPLGDIQKLNPKVSSGTARLIMKMLVKNAGERYQNWMEALVDIIRLEKASLSAKAAPALAAPADTHRASATIPLQVIGEHKDSQGTARAEPSPAESGDFKLCPYCAEPIRKQAVYCRYCGKEVQTKPGLSTDIKKKPKMSLSPQRQKAVSLSDPISGPGLSLKIKQASPFWGLLRMVLSFALIVFLSVYGYYKLVKGVDIMVPIRLRLLRTVVPALQQGQWKLEQWIGSWRASREAPQPLESPSSPAEAANPETGR